MKNKQTNFLKVTEKEDNSFNTNNSSEDPFFCDNRVVNSCYEPIRIRFEALINSKCEAPYDWYKDLGLDKGNASKIRRGLVIPPEYLRIKIAHYFEVDSSTIWKVKDLIKFEQIKKREQKVMEGR